MAGALTGRRGPAAEELPRGVLVNVTILATGVACGPPWRKPWALAQVGIYGMLALLLERLPGPSLARL